MSQQEYLQTLLMNSTLVSNSINQTAPNRILPTVVNTPSSVNTSIPNYNSTSSCGPVVNQGQCGCCWAFATAWAINSNYFINFNSSLTFSPQQLVDCGVGTFGCNGGWPSNALTYIQNNGIMYDASYPFYSGATKTGGNCQYAAYEANKVVTSYSSCIHGSGNGCNRNSIISMLANGPIIVVIDASSPFSKIIQEEILESCLGFGIRCRSSKCGEQLFVW